MVLDNYATHKHPKVRAWLARHPRFVFHFTPKSCSWLNTVETLFSRLTAAGSSAACSRSIVELQAALNRFLAETNADPKRTAHPDRVIAVVQRGTQPLESVYIVPHGKRCAFARTIPSESPQSNCMAEAFVKII
jgi:hypothetical protein